MRSRRSLPLALLVGVVALLAACGPRYARTVVRDDGALKAVLRAQLRDGDPVPRGFSHPVTISGVRLAHILSRLDVRTGSDEEGGGERRPAIATELVYELGNLLSEALARADPSQEVVIQALRKERRFGIFTQEFYTSLVAWVQGDALVVHLSSVDVLVPKGGEDEIREPVAGREVMAFKVLPAEGIVPVGPQAVSVAWRDPIFRDASAMRVAPGGKVIRRTILMEAPPEEVPAENLPVPADPATLRALADLEEARRNGAITELEYQERRRDLLRAAAESPGEDGETP